MNTSARSVLTLLVCAVFTLVSVFVSANPIVPPELYDAIQEGENLEIIIVRDQLNAGDEWTRSLTRESDETGVEVIFERQVFSYEDDWECEEAYCHSPDEDSCDVDASTCYDCDGDDVLECPESCEYWECYLSVIDECVPPGEVNYRIYEQETEYQCSKMDDLGTIIDDVGQECPMGEDNDFVCLEEDEDGYSDSDSDSDSDTESDDDNNDEGDYSVDGYPPENDSGCSATPAFKRGSLVHALLSVRE